MPNISATAYDHWNTCHRFYYWEDVVQLERVRDEGAAGFGKMYHGGLEHWWRAMDGGDVPWREADAALVAAIGGVHENAKHVNTDPFEIARAEAMLTVYHARYFELEFESVYSNSDGVELWFRMPLIDPDGRWVKGWQVTGRKDALKKFADGRKKVVEHKTAGSEIHVGSDYWTRTAIDTQISIYVDAARFAGENVDRALLDVSRKPENRPLLKTPDEKRKLTKGKGCPHCGGRAGGKQGAAQGTGRIMIRTQVDGDGNKLPKPVEVESTCTSCNGTGWQDAPRLQANQRTEDEKPIDFKMRLMDDLTSDPDKFFRMADVKREDQQLLDTRADLYYASGMIGAALELARKATPDGNLHAPDAMRPFTRNTKACLSVYGRRCAYLDLCSGAVPNALASPLYQIRERKKKAKVEQLDEKGRVVATAIAPVS